MCKHTYLVEAILLNINTYTKKGAKDAEMLKREIVYVYKKGGLYFFIFLFFVVLYYL